MRKNVRRTLDDFKKVLNNWIESYEKLFDGKGGNTFWYEELLRDFNDHAFMSPIVRLYKNEFITLEEFKKFEMEIGEILKGFYEECLEKDKENGEKDNQN